MVPRALCPVFMFCAPLLISDGTEHVWSHFHVLRSRTCFWQYRRHRVSFSAVPRLSGFVFMFCTPGLIFGGAECVWSSFHVLRTRTRFRRYRGLVFMFCTPGLIFGGNEGVRCRFHVLCVRTHFQRYRGRLVPFSCFELPDMYFEVQSVSGPVFMFCASRLVFDSTEGVGPRFHVLHSRTHFWRYRGRRVPFSCFARPYSFTTVQRSSGPVFIFCAPGLDFGGVEGVDSRIHVLAPGLVFGGTEGVGFRFHVYRARTRFLSYRGRPIPFSCFAHPDSFFVVPSASCPVFMFCAPELVFSGTEGVGSHFQVLRSHNDFRRYRGRPVLFSCFALSDTFSTLRWA
jgi:hypothetical protein